MTKKVTCSLPNASGKISGVDFELVDGVRVAVVADEAAELFAGIRGYEIEDVQVEPVQASLVPPVDPAAPEAPKPRGGRRAKAEDPAAETGADGDETKPAEGSDE